MITHSRHDEERDRIAESWNSLSSFTCAACHEEKNFPRGPYIQKERWVKGQFRADIALMSEQGEVLGTCEVVVTHPPRPVVLAAQESQGFAYYRLLQRNREAVWLCSPDCWRWYTKWGDTPVSSPWEATRCDRCDSYICQNSLSWFEFRDWGNDPHYAYCIHCAAAYSDAQWRTPGELAGGDPRDWTPDDDADPASLLLAYREAEFWAMVWTQRVAKLDDPYQYDGTRHEEAENATTLRLPMVNAAFDAGEWARGADLLLPIGAPAWQDNSGEPLRLLSFRPDNCRGTAAAWNRLLSYRLEQLPEELGEIVKSKQTRLEVPKNLSPYQRHCRNCGTRITKTNWSGEHDERCYPCKIVEEREQQERAEQRRQEQHERFEQEKRLWEEFQEWFNSHRLNGPG